MKNAAVRRIGTILGRLSGPQLLMFFKHWATPPPEAVLRAPAAQSVAAGSLNDLIVSWRHTKRQIPSTLDHKAPMALSSPPVDVPAVVCRLRQMGARLIVVWFREMSTGVVRRVISTWRQSCQQEGIVDHVTEVCTEAGEVVH